jgi:SP family myo-inositol transporter-like MFS transporter 13
VNLSGLVIYLLAFAIGLGATPWTINSEIYPLHLRGLGCSLSTSANWIANYIISALFLSLTTTDTGKVVTYATIALFNLLMLFFVLICVPET